MVEISLKFQGLTSLVTYQSTLEFFTMCAEGNNSVTLLVLIVYAVLVYNDETTNVVEALGTMGTIS